MTLPALEMRFCVNPGRALLYLSAPVLELLKVILVTNRLILNQIIENDVFKAHD